MGQKIPSSLKNISTMFLILISFFGLGEYCSQDLAGLQRLSRDVLYLLKVLTPFSFVCTLIVCIDSKLCLAGMENNVNGDETYHMDDDLGYLKLIYFMIAYENTFCNSA